MIPGIIAGGIVASGGSPAFGTHSYWRVMVLDNHGDASFITINEVEFLDGSGNVIPATGGTAFASSNAGGSPAANAFGGGGSSGNWTSSTGNVTNQHIGYQYPSGVGAEKVRLTLHDSSSYMRAPKDCELQYSDDGVSYTTAFSFTLILPVAGQQRTYPEAANPTGYHRAFRLFCANNNGSASSIILDELEMRATSGGADQTSNVGNSASNPGGRVVFSGQSAGNEAYRLFNNITNTGNYWASGVTTNGWAGFIFPNPVKVEEIALTSANTAATRAPKDMELQYSDDGVNWTTQKTFAAQTGWSTNETRVLTAI